MEHSRKKGVFSKGHKAFPCFRFVSFLHLLALWFHYISLNFVQRRSKERNTLCHYSYFFRLEKTLIFKVMVREDEIERKKVITQGRSNKLDI